MEPSNAGVVPWQPNVAGPLSVWKCRVSRPANRAVIQGVNQALLPHISIYDKFITRAQILKFHISDKPNIQM